MGAVASIAAFGRTLVKREQYRSGGCAELALQRVAGRVRIGPGTLGNIIRRRVKTVCVALAQRIIAAAIADIEAEKRQLEHERDGLLALGCDADPAALAHAEEGLAIVRQGLARMRGGQ